MTSKEKLVEATVNTLSDNEIEELNKANEKLKHLKNSQELVDLVEDYLTMKFDSGFPIYLISKKSRWWIYSGSVIDENTARFLVGDTVSTKILDIHTVYKYYEFSDKARY